MEGACVRNEMYYMLWNRIVSLVRAVLYRIGGLWR
jgi:hypothetical protein